MLGNLLSMQKSKKLSKAGVAGLTIGALGIVYGDIGTSPLYAINEIFFGHAHVDRSESTVLKLILGAVGVAGYHRLQICRLGAARR